MSEYYRGGSFVPTTRSTTTREPTSGDYYARTGTQYYWVVNTSGYAPSSTSGSHFLIYANAQIIFNIVGNFTTFTTGGWTYVMGTLREFIYDSSYNLSVNYRGVYRQQTTTVSINTGVPSSGTISLNQLLGAENP
jgi:hypothetical protein